jgi:hypothetical protein
MNYDNNYLSLECFSNMIDSINLYQKSINYACNADSFKFSERY